MYKNTELNRKLFVFISSGILFLQSGLRNVGVGVDTYGYSIDYEETKLISWHETYYSILDYYILGVGKDPGYLVFKKLILIFSDNYNFFLCVVAALFFYSLSKILLNYLTSINELFLSYIIYVVLFLTFYSFTGTRQVIATSIVFFAFNSLMNRRGWSYFLAILLASSIHKSALIMLPFYLISQYDRPGRLMLFNIMLFPILMFFSEQMMGILKVAGGYKEYHSNSSAGTPAFTAIYLMLCFFLLLKSKEILESQPNSKVFFNAASVGLVFLPLSWINPSALRLVMYFSIFLVILVPVVVSSFSIKLAGKEINKYYLIILVLIVLYLQSSTANYDYRFFWQEMKLPDVYLGR
nr:EpsG family protein [Pseudoalteromonas sp. K222D]